MQLLASVKLNWSSWYQKGTRNLQTAGFPCTAYREQGACLLVTAKATHTICARHDPKLVEINDNVFIVQLGFCLSQVASILILNLNGISCVEKLGNSVV